MLLPRAIDVGLVIHVLAVCAFTMYLPNATGMQCLFDARDVPGQWRKVLIRPAGRLANGWAVTLENSAF